MWKVSMVPWSQAHQGACVPSQAGDPTQPGVAWAAAGLVHESECGNLSETELAPPILGEIEFLFYYLMKCHIERTQ